MGEGAHKGIIGSELVKADGAEAKLFESLHEGD